MGSRTGAFSRSMLLISAACLVALLTASPVPAEAQSQVGQCLGLFRIFDSGEPSFTLDIPTAAENEKIKSGESIWIGRKGTLIEFLGYLC